MSEQSLGVYKAINAVQAAMAKEGISKAQKNQQQGYAFRGIDDCYNALATHLAANKLCVIPRFVSQTIAEHTSKNGGAVFSVQVEGEFDFVSVEDGSKHTARMFGYAFDFSDKAGNKAASAAYKYVLLQTFCIPTEGDNDADATTIEVASKSSTTARQSSPPPKQTATSHPSATSTPSRGSQLQAMIMKLGDLAEWAPVYFREFVTTSGTHCWLGPDEGIDKLAEEQIAKYLAAADKYNAAILKRKNTIEKENEGK